ncbi:MAG: TonB-dependent receptor [Flavobacteriaceae bacterium]|nr:TonB-dependent receptor [Flavobacteriaceae bacterium]|tara:strand:- start:2091 stop:4589 length:2499 start_codon:yes stop_codon:yes gene_type:complete
MFKKIAFLFIISFSITTNAQRPSESFQKFNLIGKVIDKDTGQPLEYATISLTNKRRPEFIQGGISNQQGDFNFEVFAGKYTIIIEYISFKKYIKEDLIISGPIDIGTIGLEIEVNSLNEVEVMAERTEVEIRLDKRIYNVGKDITVRGGSVADVLDNVPSVSVDVDGTVALRGNSNVRILINGKPSGLVGISGPQGLRSLPAESIEKVEVVTSPSARYDAEGTAGILNIILRKQDLIGLNGNFNINKGWPRNYRGSAALNWRRGKWNLFSTTTITDNLTKSNYSNNNEYFNRGLNSTYLNEKRTSNRNRKSLFNNLGIEYYINEKSSLVLTGFYRDNDNINYTNNDMKELTVSNDINKFIVRTEDENEIDNSFQYSLDYDNEIDEKGQKLTARIQYEESTEDEYGKIESSTKLPNLLPSTYEKVSTLEYQKRILSQFDYVWPINESTQFEFGYRGTFNTQSTDYEVGYLIGAYQQNEQDNIYDIDTNLSNKLIYKEYVNAIYSQYGKKINSFSYLLGLRMENSNIQIDQQTTLDYTQKKYTDFFPTINLSYELNELENFTLGYSRRIRRPRARFINPFPSRSSVTNIFQGNPDIDPSYSNTFDFGYLKRWNKISLFSSVYYRKSTKVFTFITQDTGETIIISGNPNDPSSEILEVPILKLSPVNLSENNRIGAEFNLTYTPSRKVRINGNFNLFKLETIGSYDGDIFDAENLSWFARLNSTIKLPFDIDWQTRMFYRGPSETAQSKRKGLISVSGALNKDILNDNGTISFRVSDIFNTSKSINETFTESFYSYGVFQWRQPTAILTFTYRLKQKKNQQRRQGNMSQGDEYDF